VFDRPAHTAIGGALRPVIGSGFHRERVDRSPVDMCGQAKCKVRECAGSERMAGGEFDLIGCPKFFYFLSDADQSFLGPDVRDVADAGWRNIAGELAWEILG